MRGKPIVFECMINASIEKVWDALTVSDQMKKWYFDIPGFIPEVGFVFQFLAGSETKKYLHLCKITEIIPGRKIAYTWRYDGMEGNSEVSFELFAEGEKTKLKLTHSGLETFKTDNPDFAKESFIQGWTYFTTKALPEFLEEK